jgi:hypothetical protein
LIFQTKVVQKIKGHILCSITFFLKIVPCTIYCGKNMADPDGSQMTISYGACVFHAREIRLHTHTHTQAHTLRICNTYCFPQQKNAAKHGARLRGWGATESDGDASQMPYVPNGMKGSTTTTTTTAPFHGNNGYSNASQCYVTRTLPLLFIYCTYQIFPLILCTKYIS